CLPNPSTDRANRCIRAAANWAQPVAQNGLTRRAELEQFQRATFVEMPDFVRCDLMPPAEAPLRKDEIDRRQRSTGTTPVNRGDPNGGQEYLSIETALGMRLKTQHCDQLSGSGVHRGKSVSNRGIFHQV